MGQPSPSSPPILSGDNKGSTAEKGKEAQKIATDGADAQGNTVGGHIGTQFREARHWRTIWTFYSFSKARPDTESKKHLGVNINIYNSCYILGLIDVAGERKDKDWALQLKFVQVPLFPTLLKWQNMARQCPRLLAACLSDLANGNVSPNFSSPCQSNIFFGAKSHSSLCSDPLPVLRFLLNSDLPDFASLATLSINAHSCQPGPGMAV